MIEIIPAILSQKSEDFIEKILAVEPYSSRVHIDIADGIFVANTTIDGVSEVSTLDSALSLEVHLMVSKPEHHIMRWLDTPVERFLFHIESTDKPQEVVDAVREAGRSVGIVLNLETPISAIEPYVEMIDVVQFMNVLPGFYGSPFVEDVLAKIADFHYFYPDKPIAVDGAVTPKTAPRLVASGASILVSGSYILKSKNVQSAIEKLQASTL